MQKYKVGLGYDIHRFGPDRKLILGGVEIPYHLGLVGHSDADVVLHALCDALLGAIGAGDIGEHFPNTDLRYKDISSLELLKHVASLVGDHKFLIGNVDIAIQAEDPKINPFKTEMVSNIANVLKLDKSDVNIKATTQEGLGAIGNKEGIAAFATALIYKA